jgi:hypothetical protein
VSNNGAFILSLFTATFASQPSFVRMTAGWIAAIVVAQAASCGLLLASRERYFALRPRILLILRALRLGCWAHMAVYPPMAVHPSSTLLRALMINTGALFSFEISLMLPLPFHQQCLFLLATVPCGVLTSLHKAASTIRAVPGLAEQACHVYGAARELSLLPLGALGGGLAAPSCPPQAPEAVAIGTYVLLGLVAPLVAPWLVEMARCSGPSRCPAADGGGGGGRQPGRPSLPARSPQRACLTSSSPNPFLTLLAALPLRLRRQLCAGRAGGSRGGALAADAARVGGGGPRAAAGLHLRHHAHRAGDGACAVGGVPRPPLNGGDPHHTHTHT